MSTSLRILALISLAAQNVAWPQDPVPRLHVKHREVIGQRFLGNESHVEHFKLLERATTSILIGARNAIYNISLHDLTEIVDQRLQWSSSGAHRELCYLKGRSEDECQNYVRVFGRQGPDRFLVCGTNAYKPMCRQFTIKDGTYVKDSDTDGLGLCPYDPRHNSTALFAEGQLYAATVADFSGGEPLIHRDRIRTERSDLNQLNGPNFVSSFAYEDYVFFFYRETAVEFMNCGKAVYSRVGRVCQHDKGGPHAFGDRWTSFLKARLNCSVPGEYPFYFNEIQSTSDVTEGVYAGERARLVYGVFTTPVNSIGGSAVCAFSMKSVLDVFQGAFKEQETINSNWLRVLPEKVPEPRPGACVNDSRTLPDVTVTFVKAHPLMDDAVQSFFAFPVITKVSFNYRFTKVAVDSQVKALDGKTYDILYIGTDDGRILKALNTRAPDSLNSVGQVIVSDVQVLKYGQAIQDLLVVHLAGEASKLVVFADSEIRAVPLHHCDAPAASTCAACVALQDPHCAWDATKNLCVAVATKLHDSDADKTLFQDITNGKHKGCGYELEMAKPVQPAVPPEIGRGEQPVERENEIVIELDPQTQRDRDAGGLLRPDSDRCSDRDLLLLAGSGFRFRFLVLSEAAWRAVPGAVGATATAEQIDRELRVAGLQQQVDQPGAERAAEEPEREERQLLGGEQTGAEGEEDVHMIQKTTQGRLRLAAGPHGFRLFFFLLFLGSRGIGRSQRRGRRQRGRRRRRRCPRRCHRERRREPPREDQHRPRARSTGRTRRGRLRDRNRRSEVHGVSRPSQGHALRFPVRVEGRRLQKTIRRLPRLRVLRDGVKRTGERAPRLQQQQRQQPRRSLPW